MNVCSSPSHSPFDICRFLFISLKGATRAIGNVSGEDEDKRKERQKRESSAGAFLKVAFVQVTWWVLISVHIRHFHLSFEMAYFE